MLAERISDSIRRSFRIDAAPSIAALTAGDSEIVFSHFRSQDPQPGLSVPSSREEAFVFNVPLSPAVFPVVCIDGRSQRVVQEPGKVYLFDLTSRHEVSLDTTYDSVRIHVPQIAVDAVARENDLPSVGGLRAKALGQDDLVLYRLAQAVLPAIRNSTCVTRAYMDHVALVLHDHIVHTYGGLPRGAQQLSGGLASWQLQRACDFIEAHLADDLSIAALSRECGVSSRHFARAFRASLGMTPHQWLIKRRIERAKSLMTRTVEDLANISIACGFVDQSHLGRHFLKQEGVSPGKWRRRSQRQ